MKIEMFKQWKYISQLFVQYWYRYKFILYAKLAAYFTGAFVLNPVFDSLFEIQRYGHIFDTIVKGALKPL